MHHLAKRVKAHYADSEDPRDWPIRNLHVGLPEHGPDASPTPRTVLREINGYDVADAASRCRASPSSQDDGSTACGCWIYSGVYADGVNQARRREPGDLDAPGGWVVARVGLGVAGEPAHALQPRVGRPGRAGRGRSASGYVWWDERAGALDGLRRARLPGRQAARTTARPTTREGMDAIAGDDPFIMMADGRGWLYAPSGLLDGPLPTHYEPIESPVEQPALPGGRRQPGGAALGRAPTTRTTRPADPRYPLVATTFRLTEHHTAGAMSRNLPWLAELQPEMFAEIDPVLAARARDRGRRLDDDRHRARARSRRARG